MSAILAAPLRRWRLFLPLLLALLVSGSVRAAEVIPPAPANHFNDYARLVSSATAADLERQLTQFERDTSNQILVAIYPKMSTDSSVDDYAVRVAQSWRVGQKDRKNGAVLFVFVQEHQLYIATGYGLEGALPDALCKRIIENEIVPRFKSGSPDAGLRAGVGAIIAATKGEYKGTGRTVADRNRRNTSPVTIIAFLVIFIVLAAISRRASNRNVLYNRGGSRNIWLGGGWGGGGGFGGGSSGGGGGSFSGGGGSFGGGGAGGKW